jgi:hypothetical protein
MIVCPTGVDATAQTFLVHTSGGENAAAVPTSSGTKHVDPKTEAPLYPAVASHSKSHWAPEAAPGPEEEQ